MAGLMPKNGFVADPGFVSVAPGIGVNSVRQFQFATMCQLLGNFPFQQPHYTNSMPLGLLARRPFPELLGTINYIFRHIRYLGPSAHE